MPLLGEGERFAVELRRELRERGETRWRQTDMRADATETEGEPELFGCSVKSDILVMPGQMHGEMES